MAVPGPPASGSLPSLLLGLSVALGAGLLIGLERERRKGRGPQRAAAGIRSFTLVALAGALAQGLAQPALVAVGALAVLLLAALAYLHSLRPAAKGPPPDPGMTTELALLVTYLIGVLAMARPAVAAGAAAVVAVLLAARGSLHRFATRVLSEDELHDGLLLAAVALVLVPLVPQQPLAWLGGLAPHQIAALVLLILLLQAAGHVALRLLGAAAGLAVSGLFSGFVSSTATVAAMGSRLRAHPAQAAACTAGAMFSTAATWLQAMLMLAAVAPSLAWRALPALAAGALLALAWGAAQALLGRRPAEAAAAAPAGMAGLTAGTAGTARAAAPDTGAGRAPPGRALRVREALIVAALLSGVALAVSLAQRVFGQAGALAGAALAGFGDAHSGVAALAAVAQQGQVSDAQALRGVLLTLATNSLTRSVVAAFSGGRAFALRMAGCLFSALAVAASLAWASGALGA
ncbi:DUF4010 domain-containing protein [Aquabacterium sp. OR-4]|uniref:DUF4010 domain-containing protein n=1 Tax=Aquabacterium sp. OR-4 TaxID=2978127 RepID=UPI0021B393EB|nr:DUF4010 domain-containing protein [Aquabacterium sp. OR-4]MDT7836799.1 DUF4010 domain-containing protein [Aquabacterium sp. OR-4]